MENNRNYEKTRKILEDNIIRLMMEKNLTARALSIRIEKNEWYITRMTDRIVLNIHEVAETASLLLHTARRM